MQIPTLTTQRPDLVATVYLLPGIDLVLYDRVEAHIPPARNGMAAMQWHALRHVVATDRLVALADGARITSATIELDTELVLRLLATDLDELGRVLRAAR